MAVNLCAAHKKTDSHAAHEVKLACFLQSCSTQRWILYSARKRACVLYMKDNSRVTHEFSPSNSTKIQEHTRVCVNLEMSCTVYIYIYIYIYIYYGDVIHQRGRRVYIYAYTPACRLICIIYTSYVLCSPEECFNSTNNKSISSDRYR